MLRTRDLTKHFGGVAATEGVTIELESGEIRGVIGPNGAGKSTLANLLCGIYRPTRGGVWLGGESLVGLKPEEISRKGLIRSFQVPRLFTHMTVYENLMVPSLARTPWAGSRERLESSVEELIAATGLAAAAELPAGQLSGGQQALLQIAMGFMVENARCYVLDEPFAGINPVLRDRIIDLIRRKKRSEKLTFLVISHEMSVMRRLCDRVSVLANGRMLTEGTVDEVTRDEKVISAYLGRSWA